MREIPGGYDIYAFDRRPLGEARDIALRAGGSRIFAMDMEVGHYPHGDDWVSKFI
jgi:hypothetical protein